MNAILLQNSPKLIPEKLDYMPFPKYAKALYVCSQEFSKMATNRSKFDFMIRDDCTIIFVFTIIRRELPKSVHETNNMHTKEVVPQKR